jgi:oligoribonuclease
MEMHKKSGLFDKIQNEGIDERLAINSLTAFLKTNVDRKLVNLAGNTVHFDRMFIVEQWPAVAPFLHHRHLDVSSFKMYAEGQGVKKFADQPAAHRAMDDIEHSLKEFNYYLQEIKKLPSK